MDSADNIYVTGETRVTGAGGRDWLIGKYDTSGTLQLQRTLGATGDEYAVAITTDSGDNLYIAGRTESTGEGSSDCFLGVLPNDGSLTGTYVLDGVNMIYQTSSLTAGTSSLTSSTSTLTDSASSLTSSASSLTAATSSLTEHTVNL